MRYIEQILTAKERFVYEGRFHWLEWWSAIVSSFLIIGIFKFIGMRSTDIVITNRRLIYKLGFISRRTEELSLSRIEEINFKQGIMGRLFGYGKITIRGTGGDSIVLPNIASPLAFRRELQQGQGLAETS